MYSSKWETAKTTKQCTGCDVHLLPGSKYLLTKFTLEAEDNLSKLMTVYLCERCIETFVDFAESDVTIAVNDNPEPNEIA